MLADALEAILDRRSRPTLDAIVENGGVEAAPAQAPACFRVRQAAFPCGLCPTPFQPSLRAHAHACQHTACANAHSVGALAAHVGGFNPYGAYCPNQR